MSEREDKATDPDHRGLAQRYLDAVTVGDVDGVMALYASDPTVEDPVGTEPKRGRAAVRAFYEHAATLSLSATLTGPVRQTPRSIAFPFELVVAHEGGATVMDVIDVFWLDADGRIARMEAHWGAKNRRRG